MEDALSHRTPVASVSRNFVDVTALLSGHRRSPAGPSREPSGTILGFMIRGATWAASVPGPGHADRARPDSRGGLHGVGAPRVPPADRSRHRAARHVAADDARRGDDHRRRRGGGRRPGARLPARSRVQPDAARPPRADLQPAPSAHAELRRQRRGHWRDRAFLRRPGGDRARHRVGRAVGAAAGASMCSSARRCCLRWSGGWR